MRRKNERVSVDTIVKGTEELKLNKPGVFNPPFDINTIKAHNAKLEGKLEFNERTGEFIRYTPHKKFGSGATSSESKLPYGDISARFLKRLAQRILHGTNSHGRGNYLRGLEKGTDVNFLRDRYNHALEHLINLREGTHIDDHIGAVAWFLMFATVAEEQFGVDWCEILTVVTPEREKEKQYGLVKKDRTSARKSRSRRNRV